MKLVLVKGDTSQSLYLYIQNDTTGAGKTGLVFNSAGLAAYYVRPLGSATEITLVTQTVTGIYSSGGFVEVSAANLPGWYRFDPPDAMLATGVESVGAMLKGASGMKECPLEIQLADPSATIAAEIQSGLATAAALTVVDDFLDTEITAIKAKTDLIPAAPAAVGDIAALFTTAMTESYNADGAAPTPAQALFVIMQRLTEFAIAGTTITVKKLNGSTTAFTLTLDDATSPTSSTRAT
jgi:hypothetical protein